MTGRFGSKRLNYAEDCCGGPPAVLTNILTAVGLMFAHMDLGVK